MKAMTQRTQLSFLIFIRGINNNFDNRGVFGNEIPKGENVWRGLV